MDLLGFIQISQKIWGEKKILVTKCYPGEDDENSMGQYQCSMTRVSFISTTFHSLPPVTDYGSHIYQVLAATEGSVKFHAMRDVRGILERIVDSVCLDEFHLNF